MVGRNMSLKNPMTPPGIDPGTVRVVAQRLNHYATPGPKLWISVEVLSEIWVCDHIKIKAVAVKEGFFSVFAFCLLHKSLSCNICVNPTIVSTLLTNRATSVSQTRHCTINWVTKYIYSILFLLLQDSPLEREYLIYMTNTVVLIVNKQ